METGTNSRTETVSVWTRGWLLDSLSFTSSDEAERYKQFVRLWAAERGVAIEIWSHRGYAAKGAAA